MEIKDNTFSRQFETRTKKDELVTVEYSFQDRKIFLTRISQPEGFEDEAFLNDLLVQIMQIAEERRLKVVPVYPRVASFFRKNPKYRELLPPGIKL